MSLKKSINLRLVLKSLLVFFVGFLVIFFLHSSLSSTSETLVTTPATPEYTLDGDEVLFLINTYRSDAGKKNFKKSERLCDWGKIRLYEVKRNWSHEGFSAVRACDLEACSVGENLAMMQTSSLDVVNAWINSPKHKEVLDMDYEEACVITEDGYAVAEFGTFE